MGNEVFSLGEGSDLGRSGLGGQREKRQMDGKILKRKCIPSIPSINFPDVFPLLKDKDKISSQSS